MTILWAVVKNCIVIHCYPNDGPVPPTQRRGKKMGFQILRTKKLKSQLSVRRSLTHSHRESETLNADRNKRHDNGILVGSEDANSALQDFKQLLPEKIRKGAVLCIEYLVTASPESMNAMTRDKQDEYFSDATKWLQKVSW